MPQTIADGLQRIINAKTDIDGAIEAKDGTVTKGLENSDEDIMTIPTGATSYSPLTEKPAIDNHTLMPGNNTSSDLGLQTKLTFDSVPTENSTNPVTSGGVYTALSGKQATIDSSHKLSADNVDDTNATNKFATAAQLQQIENNKTNILAVADQTTQYNLLPITKIETSQADNLTIVESGGIITINGTQSGGIAAVGIPFNIKAGQYYVQGCPSGGSDNTYRVDIRTTTGGALYSNDYDYGAGFLLTVSTDTTLVYNIRLNDNNTYTNIKVKPMIIPKDLYDAGFTDFQPYALPNTKITPELIELVDSGAKNLWATPNGTVSGWRETFTGVLPKGDYVISFTNLTSTDTDANTCQIIGVKNSSVASNYAQCPRGNNVYTTLSLTSDIDSIWVYSSNSSGSGDGDTATFTGCMICTKAAWDVSQKFVPYLPSYKEAVEQVVENKNNISNKIGASDYATQNTGGTVRVWTTTDGTDTILHIANEAPTP